MRGWSRARSSFRSRSTIYQRTYRWTTNEQPAQLCADIVEQADLSADPEQSKSTHFLGSVVLAPVPANDATCPRWLVVDGQQRLTTLSLALAAYRDHRAADDPRIKERLDDQYLVNKYKEGDLYLRLLPTLADRAAYTAVSARPGTATWTIRSSRHTATSASSCRPSRTRTTPASTDAEAALPTATC